MKLLDLIESTCAELLKHKTIKEVVIKIKGDKTTIIIEKNKKDDRKQ